MQLDDFFVCVCVFFSDGIWGLGVSAIGRNWLWDAHGWTLSPHQAIWVRFEDLYVFGNFAFLFALCPYGLNGLMWLDIDGLIWPHMGHVA